MLLLDLERTIKVNNDFEQNFFVLGHEIQVFKNQLKIAPLETDLIMFYER